MTTTRIALISVAAALVAAVSASAATPAATITIRHALHGCHNWSVNGGALKPAQSIRVAHGTAIVFRNYDVMPHTLVQVSGPKIKLPKAADMGHMMASFTLKLPKAGTYKFKTVAGEDYMEGVKTIGEDNVLTLTVKVT